VARKDKDARLTALLHHVTVERLEAAYRAIRPGAAPGVDGVTWKDYGQDLEVLVLDLPALAVGAAQQIGRIHRPALPFRPDFGYVSLTTTPERHRQHSCHVGQNQGSTLAT
jgi:hypothetical protein